MLAASRSMEVEIFVVDNASTDGSQHYLPARFPQVKFSWCEQNLGFGKASNSVLKEATGEYVLFLNPDTIIAEDSLSNCYAFFSSNPTCAALGVQMFDGNGRFLRESKRAVPTPLNSFFKMLGFTKLFPSSNFFSGYYAGGLPQKQSNPVDVLAGAYMMLSRKAIEFSGGFDEDYFMYGEDVDLCYRLKKAGLGVYYYSDTSIIHFKGESTQRLSKKYIKHFYGAMWLFVKKHYANKKFLRFFMRCSITLSKSIATLKLLFTAKKNQELPLSEKNLTVVIAGQEHFNECLRLLQHAKPSLVIAGRISPLDKDDQHALGSLKELDAVIRARGIAQLVFSSRELSFKKIIDVMEKMAGSVNFLFHAAGSDSMVGSNDQHSKGIVIARDQQV